MLKSLYVAAKDRARTRWHGLLRSRPDDLILALRQCHGAASTNLMTLDPDRVPGRVGGFHDLAYLFACHPANRGIVAQDFDEAAYLWKLAVEREPENILEIGRWLGGSTVLLCSAASQYGGSVVSVDSKVQAPEYASDEVLEAHLEHLGLDNYELCVASSYTFDPGRKIQLAFIDGDHSYAGVKKDFDNVVQYLSPGADVLFHDSCVSRRFATEHSGVARLMREIHPSPRLERIHEVGSITHFRTAGA